MKCRKIILMCIKKFSLLSTHVNLCLGLFCDLCSKIKTFLAYKTSSLMHMLVFDYCRWFVLFLNLRLASSAMFMHIFVDASLLILLLIYNCYFIMENLNLKILC